MSESQPEFWLELQKNPHLQDRKNLFQPPNKSFQELTMQQIIQELTSMIPETYQRERFAQILNRIRQAGQIHYQTTLRTEQNKLHAFYKKKIHELSKQNLQLLGDLKSDYDKLKMNLTKKDWEIQNLQSILIKQQNFIAKQRLIAQAVNRPPVFQRKNNHDQSKKKKKALDIQIQAFKDLVQLYHDQADQAKAQLLVCQSKLAATEGEFQKEKDLINQQKAKKEKELKEELQKVQDYLEKYKSDTGKELDVNHVVKMRQTELLATLQNQLRSAKIVLQTPRLRFKFRDRNRTVSVENAKLPVLPKKKKKGLFGKNEDRGNQMWTPKPRMTRESLYTRASPGFSSPET